MKMLLVGMNLLMLVISIMGFVFCIVLALSAPAGQSDKLLGAAICAAIASLFSVTWIGNLRFIGGRLASAQRLLIMNFASGAVCSYATFSEVAAGSVDARFWIGLMLLVLLNIGCTTCWMLTRQQRGSLIERE